MGSHKTYTSVQILLKLLSCYIACDIIRVVLRHEMKLIHNNILHRLAVLKLKRVYTHTHTHFLILAQVHLK